MGRHTPDNTDAAAQEADDRITEKGTNLVRYEIFGTSTCPYCDKAKELLTQKGQKFAFFNIDEDEEAFDQLVGRIKKWKTVPQIFYGAKHIGGYDDLVASFTFVPTSNTEDHINELKRMRSHLTGALGERQRRERRALDTAILALAPFALVAKRDEAIRTLQTIIHNSAGCVPGRADLEKCLDAILAAPDADKPRDGEAVADELELQIVALKRQRDDLLVANNCYLERARTAEYSLAALQKGKVRAMKVDHKLVRFAQAGTEDANEVGYDRPIIQGKTIDEVLTEIVNDPLKEFLFSTTQGMVTALYFVQHEQ